MNKPEPSRTISADEWRQIVDSAVGTAVITTDLQGRVTSWNEGASRMLGWTASEVLGDTLERLFPPGKGASALRQEMSDALTVGRGGGVEGWRIRRDGSQVWAVGEMSPIRDHTGLVVGFTKILRDRMSDREAQARSAYHRRRVTRRHERSTDRRRSPRQPPEP